MSCKGMTYEHVHTVRDVNPHDNKHFDGKGLPASIKLWTAWTFYPTEMNNEIRLLSSNASS